MRSDFDKYKISQEIRSACDSVIRLMDQCIEIAENNSNSLVVDMFVEQFYDEVFSVKKDELYMMYRFCIRMHGRLLANPSEREFNQVSVEFNDTQIRITNYDYNTFKWCCRNNYCEGLSNGWVDIKREKLPPAIERHLMGMV